MALSASIKNYGIIGSSLGHTLSPLMHATAFSASGIQARYGVFDVKPDILPAFISSFNRLGFEGANVTIPFKQSIIPLLDSLSNEAKILGAVNTIVRREKELVGCNTDISGLFASLAPFKEQITGSQVVLFGAGGAARSALHVLAGLFNVSRIIIVNRSAERAAEMLDSSPFGSRCRFCSDPGVIKNELSASRLIINATPAGMNPNTNAEPIDTAFHFSSEQIVFDMVYNPRQTKFLAHAAKDGAACIGGLGMLIGQGAAAFELWTGKSFPETAVRSVLEKAAI